MLLAQMKEKLHCLYKTRTELEDFVYVFLFSGLLEVLLFVALVGYLVRTNI